MIDKSFMFSHFISQLMVHNKNIESLHEHVPKEILPEEYGGSGDSIQENIGLF